MEEKVKELYEMCFNKSLHDDMQMHGIFHVGTTENAICTKCNKEMIIKRTNTFKLQAKCRICEGKRSLGLLKSNFSGRNSVELVYLIYYFSLGCNFSIIKKLTRCTNYNIKNFQNAILEVINSYVEENKEKIGGKDMI
ncbi:hypothetical protein H311_04873, partial [Anncaliia algerae PRA109]